MRKIIIMTIGKTLDEIKIEDSSSTEYRAYMHLNIQNK